MTQPDIIQTILKDSNYHLDLFTNTEVQAEQKLSSKRLAVKRLHLSDVPFAEGNPTKA